MDSNYDNINMIYNPINLDNDIDLDVDIDLLLVLTTETKKYKEYKTAYNECPIECCKFKADDLVTQIKKCKHMFLKNSIKKWLNSSYKCPVCRYNLKDEYDNSPWLDLYYNPVLNSFYTPQVIEHYIHNDKSDFKVDINNPINYTNYNFL